MGKGFVHLKVIPNLSCRCFLDKTVIWNSYGDPSALPTHINTIFLQPESLQSSRHSSHFWKVFSKPTTPPSQDTRRVKFISGPKVRFWNPRDCCSSPKRPPTNPTSAQRMAVGLDDGIGVSGSSWCRQQWPPILPDSPPFRACAARSDSPFRVCLPRPPRKELCSLPANTAALSLFHACLKAGATATCL